jgi:hypothetical protein
MSQERLDFRRGGFDPDEAWGPPGRAEIFVDSKDAVRKSRKLLAYCRQDSRLPATDRELFPILYYADFQKLQKIPSFACLHGFGAELSKAFEDSCLKRVKSVISSINNTAFKLSRRFERRQDWLEYLWNEAELIIPVDETESGELLRDYHGPSKRQPLEILNRAIELRIAHREQQSQPLYLMQDLKASSVVGDYGPLFSIPTHSTLDLNCNTPDEEMDHFISDEIGDNEQHQL